MRKRRAGCATTDLTDTGSQNFGQTVNLSARIGEYAGPGEVLVSQAVAEVSEGKGIRFGDIGPVELKGVSGPVHMLRANLE